MSHVVTSGELIHWGIFLGFIFLVAASAVVWLAALGGMMSDSPSDEMPRIVLWGVPGLALVTFAIWCIV